MTVDTTPDPPTLGVHSEVGRLRKVLVCAPGLAHRRLTPTNCDELLFDDVLWVDRARQDHRAFVADLRARGVEVLELHEALAQILARPEARAWLLDRKIVANEVGPGLVTETRSFLDGLDDRTLAEHLIGGLATTDLPDDLRPGYVALARDHTGARDYLMPPLPNTLYTRDTTCWIYGGRHAQSAVLAGPPRRDAHHEGPLPVPPRPGGRHRPGGATPRSTGAWRRSRAAT